MANNDIKQRIVLEGEKEYKQALKDAGRNLKTLRSELKAETAELGNNAKAKEKNAVKAKNLQKQIQEQEKVVRAYTDALEEVRKKYGDNEDAIAKYEQKLNDARTALANMKNEYNSIGEGAKKGILENNALAESFSRISDMAKGMSDAIGSAFSSLLSTIKSTVGAVWGELMDIAAKADNYMDLASYFGSTATEVQKWDSAMKAAAGDISTVTSLITKLKYSGKDKKVTEWFGISAENYTNDLEYFEAVMNQMVKSRDEMLKNGTWNKAMEEIFGGKKAFDVEGVLSDWEDIQEGLKRFNADEGGYGLSEDQIEKMADLNIQVQTLKESWQKLKEMATVHLFGDLAVRITGNLQNIMDAFKDYINADNDYARKEALDAIKRNVKEMFYAIRDAIKAGVEVLNELATEFKNDDDPAAKTIGNVLQFIADTIEWLADPENWERIKAGIMIVLGTWLFTKLAAVVTAITGIASSLKTIFTFKAGGAAAAASGAGAAAGHGTSAAASAGASAATGGLFSGGASAGGLGTGISGASTTLLGAAGGLAVTAAFVYGISELVNSVNSTAQKAREVARDENRLAETLRQVKQDYSFGGINREAGARNYIQGFIGQTGEQAYQSEYAQMRNLAILMGSDIVDLFNYTNTSGQKKNKLIDMLSMDNQNAAVAAMMLQAAGVDPADIDYSGAYQIYKNLTASGSLGTEAYGTLNDFFSRSAQFDSNGRIIIPGATGNNEIMPVINGVPLANMSGYVMTAEQNKPRYSNGQLWYGRPDIENQWGVSGTWDPNRSVIRADEWMKQSGMRDDVSGMTKTMEKLPNDIIRGISNIKVVMDGQAVGLLVAPIVSQQIAREAQ